MTRDPPQQFAAATSRGPRDGGARAFGAYVRLLREHARGGRGKTLRQLARETGIAPSVLSRGERGLQDLRQADYIDRLAPYLGVRGSVLRRVAAVITRDEVERLRPSRREEDSGGLPARSASRVLWAKLHQELERLRGASPETLEALLAYTEFLAARAEGNR